MGVVIALEGGDGTGKSTIGEYIQELCQDLNLTSTTIGRYANDASKSVASITELLQWAGELPPLEGLSVKADASIRIARDYQRALLVHHVQAQVVLLDRFVISSVARMRKNEIYTNDLENIATDVIQEAELVGTILCVCPFDTAWTRVLERAKQNKKALSAKEKKGKEYNRKLVDLMKNEFDRGLLTRRQWEVDTSRSIEESKEVVKEMITPILADLATH